MSVNITVPVAATRVGDLSATRDSTDIRVREMWSETELLFEVICITIPTSFRFASCHMCLVAAYVYVRRMHKSSRASRETKNATPSQKSGFCTKHICHHEKHRAHSGDAGHKDGTERPHSPTERQNSSSLISSMVCSALHDGNPESSETRA